MAEKSRWRLFRKRIQYGMIDKFDDIWDRQIEIEASWTSKEARGQRGKELNEEEKNELRFANLVKSLCDENISDDKFDDKIKQIAMSSYCNGAYLTKLGGRLLTHLMRLLDHQSSSLQSKVYILQFVVLICWKNRENQDAFMRDKNHSILIRILNQKKSELLCRWACYCVVVLMIRNVQVMEVFKDHSDFYTIIRTMARNYKMWSVSGWPINYAEIALKIVSHHKKAPKNRKDYAVK